MIRLELSDSDADRLLTLCRESLSNLRLEIARTDSVEFREALKNDERFLKGLIERLAVPAQTASQ
jgi:hypothetical protein